MIFWAVAGLLALGVVALMGVALARPGDAAAESADLGVYRDQLAAVDRDVARGVVTEAEAERMRTEIKRRVLDADKASAPAAGVAPRGATLGVGVAAVVVVVGGSLLGYMSLGAPGYPDLPLKARLEAAAETAGQRPSQAEAEDQVPAQMPPQPRPDFLALMERLRAAVAERPDDTRGLRLLVRNEAGLGNYGAAAAAQDQLIAVLGDAVTASDWGMLAELRLTESAGAVTEAVRTALDAALSLDPSLPGAIAYRDLITLSDGGPIPMPTALAQAGDFAGAHQAQARLIGLIGDRATATDYADLADLRVLAAGGYVSPEAEKALTQALARDPQNGTALYYTGLMRAQTGRPDLAFQIWERQLRVSPSEAPWVPPIRAQIEAAATAAGIDYRLPVGGPIAPGPDADQVAAAAEMSPADRMAMIENMVGGLAERLATEGGPPEDWARLIRAYGVLGRTDAAATVWAEAQSVFPDDVTRVPILQAARDAGVEQ